MSMVDLHAENDNIHKPSLTSKFALKAIEGYRQNKLIRNTTRVLLSGRTEFKCASGAMGLPTCSTAGAENFRNYPLWEAIKRQQETFKTCSKMSKILKIVEDNSPDEASSIIQMQFGEAAEKAEQLVLMASNENEKKKTRHNNNASSSGYSSRCCSNTGGPDGADAACCMLALIAEMS